VNAHWARSRTWVAFAAVAALALAPSSFAQSVTTFVPGVIPDHWLTGGPDCTEQQADFQIHHYSPDLYILRESGCIHFEKPFIFLLFGQDKVLLLDTGAGSNTDTTTGRDENLRATVDFVIGQWLRAHNRTAPIHLVVAHLHSHPDHIFGDYQFTNRPDTTFVPPGNVQVLIDFFGFRHWPKDIVQYDLGSRVLDVLATPGHDPTELAIYDRQTGLLLVGDSLYPGRLYINQPADIYQDSIQRMVDFTADKPTVHVLGTHIERKAPYTDYFRFEHNQPVEVPLQLGRSSLLELLDACKQRDRNGNIVQKIYRDFTICSNFPNCNPINATGP
jgi:glyoxylase-like metal-dependent hydrolase (beta-lactamase superfamily II)